jgi:hypothetical protein
MRWLPHPISAVAAAMARIALATKPSLALDVKFIAFFSLRMMQSGDQGLRIQVKSGLPPDGVTDSADTLFLVAGDEKRPGSLSLKPSPFKKLVRLINRTHRRLCGSFLLILTRTHLWRVPCGSACVTHVELTSRLGRFSAIRTAGAAQFCKALGGRELSWHKCASHRHLISAPALLVHQ